MKLVLKLTMIAVTAIFSTIAHFVLSMAQPIPPTTCTFEYTEYNENYNPGDQIVEVTIRTEGTPSSSDVAGVLFMMRYDPEIATYNHIRAINSAQSESTIVDCGDPVEDGSYEKIVCGVAKALGSGDYSLDDPIEVPDDILIIAFNILPGVPEEFLYDNPYESAFDENIDMEKVVDGDGYDITGVYLTIAGTRAFCVVYPK